jgi:hypothetical protein
MRSFKKSLLLLSCICLVFGLIVVSAEAGKPDKVENCSNGRDDDKDGLVDCDDPDCDSDPACSGGTTDPQCLQSYMVELADFTAVTDDSPPQSDPYYFDGVDKVMAGSKETTFRFDTQVTKPNKNTNARTVQLDLDGFNLGQCPPGEDPCEPSWFEGVAPFITIDMRFQIPPGGLNLCALCVYDGGDTCKYGPPLGDGCFMGAEGDAGCETSSQGKVGLHITFPVEDATYDQMQLHYGMRQSGEYPCGSDPVLVTRISETEWTIQGTTACLKDGGVQGDYVEIDDHGDPIVRDAPFFMTITRIP